MAGGKQLAQLHEPKRAKDVHEHADHRPCHCATVFALRQYRGLGIWLDEQRPDSVTLVLPGKNEPAVVKRHLVWHAGASCKALLHIELLDDCAWLPVLQFALDSITDRKAEL